MLKLKLQYSGHLMQRAKSLEKTLMLGKVEAGRKGTTADETVGWHHRFYGHEFEQAPGVGDRQGSLACCSLNWCLKEGMAAYSSILENPMDRVWQATVHRATRSQKPLKQLSTHSTVSVKWCLSGFDFHFSNDYWCCIAFMCLLAIYNLLWRNIYKSSLPVLNGVVCSLSWKYSLIYRSFKCQWSPIYLRFFCYSYFRCHIYKPTTKFKVVKIYPMVVWRVSHCQSPSEENYTQYLKPPQLWIASKSFCPFSWFILGIC